MDTKPVRPELIEKWKRLKQKDETNFVFLVGNVGSCKSTFAISLISYLKTSVRF